jgi:16S rRNA (cytosine967-C5)-methyltransferase
MRTPARAAVHEGVEAVRAARKEAAGFGNAVLRRLAEAAPSFPWGDPASDDGALARSTGHPLWLVRLLVEDLGRPSAIQVLEADSESAPLYLWANPFKGSFVETMNALSADGAEPVANVLPGSIRAGSAHAAVRGEAVASGRALITDLAAQVAPSAVRPELDSIVIDIAAGRGTKTAQIQAACVAAGGQCRLFAVDVHGFKADVLRRRMADLGVPGVTALVGDATRPAEIEGMPAAGSADAVLVDAPCSGLGTLRRHPEKRWKLDPDDLQRLSVLQSELLAAAASLVRVGGRVVYSTCSVAEVENGGVVGKFLAESDGSFAVCDLGPMMPQAWQTFVTAEGYFQSLPHRDGPDGHFVAALERVR